MPSYFESRSTPSGYTEGVSNNKGVATACRLSSVIGYLRLRWRNLLTFLLSKAKELYDLFLDAALAALAPFQFHGGGEARLCRSVCPVTSRVSMSVSKLAD